MKKKTVWQIGVLVLAVVAVAGCATGGKGPSDQELVKALLGSWKGAIIEKSADKIGCRQAAPACLPAELLYLL